MLVVCITAMGLPLQANAGMLGTEVALAGADREAIASFVDRAEVRAKLEAYGASPADVKARVASMTDEEAALVAGRIDELPAGGVVGAIVLVFLVLLLTDILGYTKIFPFTRSVK
jgi:ABC-type nitrate/sulfonate/bicarbonate transport system substrate-binding protein